MELKDLIDESEIPWPTMTPPRLAAGRYGDWQVSVQPPFPILRGYFRGLQKPEYPNVRLKDPGGVVWMSLTPMELESQAHHVHYATGHTVIAGGGMGVAMANIMKKDTVHRVTVIEKEPEIIELLSLWARMYEWPGREKVRFIEEDARTVTDLGRIDYLFVDIWPHLMSEAALKDTQRIQGNLEARKVGYWGQELDFISYMHDVIEKYGSWRKPLKTDFYRWGKEVNLPFVIRDKDRLWFWSYKAAQNVHQY